ncbi:MAG: metal-dependent transcriptional regulator [Phycisphaerales bacterium]
MPSETVENYLKAVYTLSAIAPDKQASVGKLASVLGVTSGTVTTMIKRLAAAKLATYERYGGVTLTEKGDRAALAVLRRHRLIETFLVETLGLDWSEVHAEAERLEHAVSDRLLSRIDDHLGNPAFDPHGDPIPTADGTVRALTLAPLADALAGASVRIARITDQDPEFLRFIERSGLKPGARVRIESINPAAGLMRLVPLRHPPVSISLPAAAKLHVELSPGG